MRTIHSRYSHTWMLGAVCVFLGTISETDLLIYSLENAPFPKHHTPASSIIWCPSSRDHKVVKGETVREALLIVSSLPSLPY